MNAAALFFYLFSAVTVGSAFMVIAAKNPVHSVLFLILAFVNAAGLFLLLGAEFLAMILVIVYVGAEQQKQPRRIDEGENEEEHGMDGIARGDDHEGRGRHDT